VDTIIIGNRGQNALSTLLLGSVAQGVTEHSHVPVLVVHEAPAHDGVHVSAPNAEHKAS
jgi:nucleotide-binding universal stress UspA family protein